MARQHKGEVMIAGEQLRYEERERGGKYDISMIRLIKVKHVDDLNFKVETTRRKADQGPTLPPAHVSELLCGT